MKNKIFESSLYSSPPQPSHPHYSFWVMASAGTGKTKLLIDRVLRLLLMGADPKKIVCLTYTKAAAHEMSARITDKIKYLITLSEDELALEISAFDYEKPEERDEENLKNIRTLLQKMHGSPVAIQTIHSFCQRILGAYPFEAGLPLDCDMMNAHESELLKKNVIHSILNNTAFEGELSFVATKMSESYVKDCLREGLDYRTKFLGDVSKFSQKRRTFFEKEYVAPLSLHEVEECFWVAKKIKQFGPKTLAIAAENILENEKHPPESVEIETRIFSALFLTKEGKPRAKVATKALLEEEPLFLDIFEKLSKRLEDLCAKEQVQDMLALNEAFDKILQGVFDRYQVVKQNKIDFDDLLIKTRSLLAHGPAWVQQMIDADIDHLLLDEAQDTSPLQWDILKHLTAHWGDRTSSTDTPRTFFIVGDMKQSIYSFQGADPYFYEDMAHYFEDAFAHFGLPFFRVPLETCYRCAPEILSVVDKVCNQDYVRSSLLGGAHPVHHHPHKKGGGKVVAWPLVKALLDDEPCIQPWTLLEMPLERKDSKKELAQHITHKVLRMLSSKDILPSTGKPPQPSDIFILMKRRGSFMRLLQMSLVSSGVPVISHDPSAFLEHLFVKDMLAFLLFLACPFDDLNLCTLLKSPAFGVSEEDLMRLCVGRKSSLWQVLSEDEKLKSHYIYLKTLLNDMYSQSCYNLLCLFSKMALPRYTHKDITTTGQLKDGVYDDIYTIAEINAIYKQLLNIALEASQQYAFAPYAMYAYIVENALSSHVFTAKPQTTGGSVTLMTIHGSKGLQAPVVILADSGDGGKGLYDAFIFGDGFHILRQQGHHVQLLKNMAKEADVKEDHRLLYVALTRAQDHVYITGIQSKQKDEGDASVTWYDGISSFADKEDWIEENFEKNADENVEEDIDVFVRDVTVVDDASFVDHVSLQALRSKHQRLITHASKENNEKAHYGVRVHKFLECLARFSLREVGQVSPKKHDLFTSFQDLSESVKDHLTALYQTAIEPLIEGGYGFQEISLYDNKGTLHRIDHVIITEKKVLILDYKTGNFHPSHKDQLERYARLLFPLYPDHVYEGLLVFTHEPLRFEGYPLLEEKPLLMQSVM